MSKIDECPICLNLMSKKFRVLRTKCGHSFCVKCFTEWSNLKNNCFECPICRKTLKVTQSWFSKLCPTFGTTTELYEG